MNEQKFKFYKFKLDRNPTKTTRVEGRLDHSTVMVEGILNVFQEP